MHVRRERALSPRLQRQWSGRGPRATARADMILGDQVPRPDVLEAIVTPVDSALDRRDGRMEFSVGTGIQFALLSKNRTL